MAPEKDDSQLKPPTTYSEQVEILKNRNLYIEDSESAAHFLQRVNYYRLSAYTLTLKDPLNTEKFNNQASFHKLKSIYEFDKKLRLLLIGVLETIEIALRAHVSYELAHKCGPLGYKEKENFINEKFHQDFLLELDNLIQKSRKGELFVEHYYRNYAGKFPIWVAIEVTSFGTLSKLFRNLNEEIKKHISKVYYNVPYFYLESWLQTLSNMRNICAHYGRLYNKHLTFKPRLFKEEHKQFNNQFIFAAIYIIERLLTKTDGNRFITDLDALISEYEDIIEFKYIGFPPNWKSLLLSLNNAKIEK